MASDQPLIVGVLKGYGKATAKLHAWELVKEPRCYACRNCNSHTLLRDFIRSGQPERYPCEEPHKATVNVHRFCGGAVDSLHRFLLDQEELGFFRASDITCKFCLRKLRKEGLLDGQ